MITYINFCIGETELMIQNNWRDGSIDFNCYYYEVNAKHAKSFPSAVAGFRIKWKQP